MKKLILFFLIIPFISFSQNCNTYYLHLNDSLGDGWNGNYLSIIDSSGATIYSTTLDSGFARVDTLCLPDDCYTVVCDSGSSQSEVLWWFTDEYDRWWFLNNGAGVKSSVKATSEFALTTPFALIKVVLALEESMMLVLTSNNSSSYKGEVIRQFAYPLSSQSFPQSSTKG